VEAELVCDLSCVHGVGQILLVGEHQQDGIPQLILQASQGSRRQFSELQLRQLEGQGTGAQQTRRESSSLKSEFRQKASVEALKAHLVQHAVQLITGLDDTVSVVAIDHEDETLGVLEVVPPERANLHGKSERADTLADQVEALLLLATCFKLIAGQDEQRLRGGEQGLNGSRITLS